MLKLHRNTSKDIFGLIALKHLLQPRLRHFPCQQLTQYFPRQQASQALFHQQSSQLQAFQASHPLMVLQHLCKVHRPLWLLLSTLDTLHLMGARAFPFCIRLLDKLILAQRKQISPRGAMWKENALKTLHQHSLGNIGQIVWWRCSLEVQCR